MKEMCVSEQKKAACVGEYGCLFISCISGFSGRVRMSRFGEEWGNYF